MVSEQLTALPDACMMERVVCKTAPISKGLESVSGNHDVTLCFSAVSAAHKVACTCMADIGSWRIFNVQQACNPRMQMMLCHTYTARVSALYQPCVLEQPSLIRLALLS